MLFGLAALGSLAAFLGNIYVVKSVDLFGSPLLFAVSLLVEVIIIIIFAYCLLRTLRLPLKIIASILGSAWQGALDNSYVTHWRQHHPKISHWLGDRLSAKDPYGLVLTLGVTTVLLLFSQFINILVNVLHHGSLTQIDVRIIHLMPSLRTPLQTNFFRFVTFTNNSQSVLLLTTLTTGILWRRRQWFAALSVISVLISSQLINFIAKNLVGRMRPERLLSVYTENSYSFPSGHTMQATALSGFLAYLLFRSFTSVVARIMIILGYIGTVVLVGLSRVYLGVHYPSDVLAAVFLGAALLAGVITVIEITVRYSLLKQTDCSFSNRRLAVVPVLVVLFSIAFNSYFVPVTSHHSIHKTIDIGAVNETTIHRLPLYSETLTGKTMEPINFIYLGSKPQLERVFLVHGWYEADHSTVANTLKAFAVGYQNMQYLQAPVTPSYLDTYPEDLAFEQPTQLNTLRQRHHTRLWRTNYTSAGREVWVATASYDEGIELSGAAKIPTHHIDPNIDNERNYIARSLSLKDTSYLQVVGPQAGRNAGGDGFFTDGRAILTML